MFNIDDRIALQFSGGKDSLACLYLLEPYWPRLAVVWCDTGDALPETVEQMAAVEALVPMFVRVTSNQPKQVAQNGPPADVVSVWATPTGRMCRNGQMFAVQTPFTCCHDNIWKPLDKACRSLGATVIVRGQRNDEKVKAPVRSGHTHEGVKYLFPIEDWTEPQVYEYLHGRGISLPKHYIYFNSSLDCGHCTAYLSENVGRMRYLREHHPSVHEEVQHRLQLILLAASTEVQHVLDATKE